MAILDYVAVVGATIRVVRMIAVDKRLETPVAIVEAPVLHFHTQTVPAQRVSATRPFAIAGMTAADLLLQAQCAIDPSAPLEGIPVAPK